MFAAIAPAAGVATARQQPSATGRTDDRVAAWQGAAFWAESTLVRPGRSDAGDVCGQEVDAVSVEVAAGAVVVLGGSGVGVAGEDLGVAQGDAGVEHW